MNECPDKTISDFFLIKSVSTSFDRRSGYALISLKFLFHDQVVPARDRAVTITSVIPGAVQGYHRVAGGGGGGKKSTPHPQKRGRNVRGHVVRSAYIYVFIYVIMYIFIFYINGKMSCWIKGTEV